VVEAARVAEADVLSMAPCSIYVHDPGPRFNTLAMNADQNSTRWTDEDHSWHVARWLHKGLQRYPHRSFDAATADVIFMAHYFLTYNYKASPLAYGAPVLQWQSVLRTGGMKALLHNDPVLLRRWKQRPSDFVAAPLYTACTSSILHHELGGARWIVTDPYLGNRCNYHHNFDLIAPLVRSSSTWDPSSSAQSEDSALIPRHGRFLTYVGRLGKPYISYPMSLLRFMMWSELLSHENVTFWATDAKEAVLPNLRDSACQKPPKVWLKEGVRCCKRCAYGCQRCLDPSPQAEDIWQAVRDGVGTAPRISSQLEYKAVLATSTFCLVLRGDTESSLKFTEAILAGCVPVLIADMPAWPFSRRLDYRTFSLEFDWRAAAAEPRRVISTLLRLPAAEVEAKSREVLRIRRHFFYQADVSRAGAVTELIADLCETNLTHPSGVQAGHEKGSTSALSELYDGRPKLMSVARISGHRVGRGALRGSLHNILIRLEYADGGRSAGHVPSEPFRGSGVLAKYLQTREGQKLARYAA
jgi:hypothetical protein